MSWLFAPPVGASTTRTPALLAGRSSLVVGLALLSFACGSVPTSPQQRTPIISFVLIADESIQFASITEAARADSAIPANPVPIDSTRVSLQLIDQAGNAHDLTPDSAPGRYRVLLAVVRGAQYWLKGTIDGQLISASTVAPTAYVIRTPPRDTIAAADGASCGSPLFTEFCVPYEFVFDGPPAFEYRVEPSGGGGALRSYQGSIVFPQQSGVRTVAFLALNQDASQWVLNSTPRSNIHGAFGAFGAALVERRTLAQP